MNRHLTIALAAATALATPFLVGACATAGASSASLGSASSLSGSSMSSAAAEHHHHYSSDVRAAARSAIVAGASEGEVLRSVGRVAERHGISDWEARSATYLAIGEALKQAGQDEASATELAPKLTGNDPQASALLLEGYRS